jgi:hypothetical protein
MLREPEDHISYERWSELTSRDVFFFSDENTEKQQVSNKLYEMYGEDINEEDPVPSPSKKDNYRLTY